MKLFWDCEIFLGILGKLFENTRNIFWEYYDIVNITKYFKEDDKILLKFLKNHGEVSLQPIRNERKMFRSFEIVILEIHEKWLKFF